MSYGAQDGRCEDSPAPALAGAVLSDSGAGRQLAAASVIRASHSAQGHSHPQVLSHLCLSLNFVRTAIFEETGFPCRIPALKQVKLYLLLKLLSRAPFCKLLLTVHQWVPGAQGPLPPPARKLLWARPSSMSEAGFQGRDRPTSVCAPNLEGGSPA